MAEKNNNYILIGMPGSGKSTIGVLLAKALGYDFVDTDLVIQQKGGGLLKEIIARIGNDGLKQLEESVADVLQTAKLNPSDGILSTERQRDAAQQAKDSLEEAIYALESGMTLDAVTVSIEGAISALLELTGERATEAVVDSVFAQFCVGK